MCARNPDGNSEGLVRTQGCGWFWGLPPVESPRGDIFGMPFPSSEFARLGESRKQGLQRFRPCVEGQPLRLPPQPRIPLCRIPRPRLQTRDLLLGENCIVDESRPPQAAKLRATPTVFVHTQGSSHGGILFGGRARCFLRIKPLGAPVRPSVRSGGWGGQRNLCRSPGSSRVRQVKKRTRS